MLPQTDWLRHDLIISGAAGDVAALQDAACGAGAIPWGDPDPDLTEEDRALALIRPPDGSPGLSVVAARVLARQLRDAEDRHRQRVHAAMGRSRACPFDLHALLPVPETLLHHGPHDAVSLAWLRQNWVDRLNTRYGRDTVSFARSGRHPSPAPQRDQTGFHQRHVAAFPGGGCSGRPGKHVHAQLRPLAGFKCNY